MYSKHCHFVAEGTEDALFTSRKMHHLPPLDSHIEYTPYGGSLTTYKVESVKLRIVGVRYPAQPQGSPLDVEERAWFIELSVVP